MQQKILATVVVLALAAILVGVAGGSEEPAPPPPAPAPPPPPLAPDRSTVSLKIRPGTTFGQVMSDWGVDHHAVRQAALAHYDLAHIRPDRELSVVYVDGAATPEAVRYRIDEDRTLVVQREGEQWSAHLDEVEYTAEVGTRSFVLTRSLWADGLDAGLRPGDLVRIARIFEYELDFNTELRAGARMALVADVLSAPGHAPRLGDLHAIRLVNDGKSFEAVRSVGDDGEEGWYHPDGTGMKRPFLRSPLEFSRVTSGFNPKRYHPILKRRRPHNGTDFGAPTGTPIRAVASGRVVFAGTNGGHGRYVKLDHEGPWETSYSHLSRLRVRNGEAVRQGQIIGHVGSSGLATGPHLHYQMWRHGKYVDAMRVELPRTASLPTSQKADFAERVARYLPKLDEADALTELPEGEGTEE